MLPFSDHQNPSERWLYGYELTPPSPKPDHTAFFLPTILPDGIHLSSTAAATSSDIPQLSRPLDPMLFNNSMGLPVRMSVGSRGFGGRRPARKDRHSKIHTAAGLRDRRMRLSMEVAREFFDLQDMLGFDKASKTLHWLLSMAKPAIEDLMAKSGSKSESYTSECEDISTVSDEKVKCSELQAMSSDQGKKTRAKKCSRKAALHPIIAKELRDKARERARERTKEKNRMLSASSMVVEEIGDGSISVSHNLKNSSVELMAEKEEKCWSSLTRREKSVDESTHEFPMEEGEPTTQEIPMFDYGQNNTSIHDQVCIFQDQWDMEAALLADAQFHSRLCYEAPMKRQPDDADSQKEEHPK